MRTLQDTKRREILAAAAAVFADKGFHAALMDDVAARAGIGKGTIYRYFAGKQELFFSILDSAGEELQAALAAAGAAALAPDLKLKTMVAAMADVIARNQPLMRLLREIGHDELEKRHGRIREQNRAVVAQLAAVIAEGTRAGVFRRGDAKLRARLITVMTHAAFHHCKPVARRATIRSLNDFFFHGIAA
ncbi:MAG TPA: TetR/AcrR family transcriptional regulator [Candidatus Edwardsbacteria bacterium]|nr:TetR/AcrR family transcriptional regulator [Candidatus Edwardsbacteria bacterium]